MTTPFNLPDDLAEFLKAGRQLKYNTKKVEPGQITLFHLDELALGAVWINSEGSPLRKKDPHADETGYYEVPAVSLVKEAEGYDPDYILLWLPREELLGTWDCDHWDLFTFRWANWATIVKQSARYVNMQWSPVRDNLCDWFQPWRDYEFKPGRPF